MDASIRIARAEDLGLVTSLMGEFCAESGYPFDAAGAAQAAASLISSPELGRLWLVARPEGSGYVAVTFGFSLEYLGRDAFLDELFIRPPFRGAGLGTQVLEAVVPACRALGVHALHLEVERRNGGARSLYQRLGFRGNDRQLLSRRLS